MVSTSSPGREVLVLNCLEACRCSVWPCYNSGDDSPTSRSGGTGSIPDRSMRDLWWTKQQCESFYSEYCGSPLQVAFHQFSTLIFLYTLPLPDEQTVSLWTPPPPKYCHFWNGGALRSTLLSLIFICLISLRKIRGNYLKIDQDSFLPHRSYSIT